MTEPSQPASPIGFTEPSDVPVKAAVPAWKKPPLARLSLGGLSLGDEILADRDEKR